MQIQNIYLDESGHTGGNLLDAAQPVFVYAAIAMDDSQASSLHSEAKVRFRIGSAELKGSNLVKRQHGRAAVSWILEKTIQSAKVMVVHKEYGLACKFFEYILEPALANRNSLFYAIDFHKFVAMVLYSNAKAGHSYARHVLEDFQHMMRTTDVNILDSIWSAIDFKVGDGDPMIDILTIALCNQERIKKEISTLKGMGTASGWPLELSSTSVNWLLASWGEHFDALRVYCDQSKPIAADLEMFANFIGRRDKAYIWLDNQISPSLVYNLSEPIHLVDSKQYSGVQIADVWASALAYARNHPEELISQQWLEISEHVVSNAVFPDPDLVNMELLGPNVNITVLKELYDRSIVGGHLTQNMDTLINIIIASFG